MVSWPLGSATTPASSGFFATTGQSASGRRLGTQCLWVLPRARSLSPDVAGSIGDRLLTFRTRAADQARAASTPDTAWPVNGLPARLIPRGDRGPSVLMSSSNFDASSATPTQDIERAVLERLPGPHLTRRACLFPVAHHDGLQPTQHRVVWRLPPQADAGGPTSISRTAPHSEAPPTWCAPPPAFVTHLSSGYPRASAPARTVADTDYVHLTRERDPG